MIKKVIQAMMDKDYKTLSSCFSEDCKYFDYCPPLCGGTGIYIYGCESVEMVFRNKFALRGLTYAEPVFDKDDSASFFVSYGGEYLYARLNIEEYDSAGMIVKAIVHPA